MRANVIVFKPDGTAVYVHDRGLTQQLDGLRRKTRASHIEPVNFWLRQLFTVLRLVAHDESPVAGWTRTWKCRWQVAIIGGPTFGEYSKRQDAIDAEVEWLEERL